MRSLRAAIICMLVLGFVTAGLWWWERGRLERSQDTRIQAAAGRYGIDAALVKAVVWRESRFHPGVQGRAGEIGLMQIREDAAQEWADAERIETFEHAHCFNPLTNLMAGTFYLAKLMKRYTRTDNPAAYALADYNAGRGNVVRWNNGEGATNSAVFLQQITYPSTRDYVIAVLDRRQRYTR